MRQVRRVHFAGAPAGLDAIVAEGADATRRGLAPAELDRLLELMLPGLAVERMPDGRPAVRGHVRGRGGLMLSLSHAVGATALAIAPFPVGIDIERYEPDIDALAIDAELFGDRDYTFLAAHDEDRRRDAFYRLWTLKEARLKRFGRTLADSKLPDLASLAGDDMSTAWLDAPARRYCLGLCWGQARPSSELNDSACNRDVKRVDRRVGNDAVGDA
jgi:hypothetical protein